MESKKKKCVFIVGAGFSKALNSGMPVCSSLVKNFIEGAIVQFGKDQEKPDLFKWRVIGYLACYGFLGGKAEIKQSGYEVVAAIQNYSYASEKSFLDNYLISSSSLKDAQATKLYSELVNQKEFIESRKQTHSDLLLIPSIRKLSELLQKSPHLYESINIENLLSQEEKDGFHRQPEAFGGETFDQIAFEELQLPISEKSTADALKQLIAELTKNFETSFLSFNYDLMLEFLVSEIWNPENGYGVTFDFSVDCAEVKKASHEYWESVLQNQGRASFPTLSERNLTPNKSDLKIYKPHGSLNWLADYDGGRLALIEQKTSDLIEIRNSELFYRNSGGDKQDHHLTTALLPPTPNKSNSLPQFWNQGKELKSVLKEADIFIVMGWSCPPSDQNWRRQLEDIFNEREKQVEHLIVINPDQDVFDRLSDIICAQHATYMEEFKNSHQVSQLLSQIFKPLFYGPTISRSH